MPLGDFEKSIILYFDVECLPGRVLFFEFSGVRPDYGHRRPASLGIVDDGIVQRHFVKHTGVCFSSFRCRQWLMGVHGFLCRRCSFLHAEVQADQYRNDQRCHQNVQYGVAGLHLCFP